MQDRGTRDRTLEATRTCLSTESIIAQPIHFIILYSRSIHSIAVLTIGQIRHLGVAILLRLRLVRLISLALCFLLGTLLRSSLLLRLEHGLALFLDFVVVSL